MENILYGIFIGFMVGVILSYASMKSYKNCLTMAAKEGHNEYINGKWYEIKEVKNN